MGYTEDVFSALDIQDELQTLYTSDTVFHAFLGEKLPDWKSAANLVRKIAENYRLPYYTLSPTYSVCKNHGYLAGEQAVCPHCGEPTEVNSRITGYYRPVQNWNDGKAQEFRDRVTYDVGASHLTHSGPLHGDAAGNSEGVCSNETTEKGYLLFATRTCPNCRILYPVLDKTGIAYEKVYADEDREAAERYDISQVPILVILDDQNVEKVVGVSAIIQRLKL